jgi:hypothetical protein
MNDTSIEAKDLLPDEIDRLADDVRTHFIQSSHWCGRIAWENAGKTALEKIREHLSFDPLTAFTTAWSEFEELHEYKDEAKHPRETDEPYDIGPNHVALNAHPQLIVRIGPFSSPPLEFMYTIEAAFEAATLTIRNGAIRAVKFGECEISGVLKTKDGHNLHEPCKLPKDRLPGQVEFKNPIQIP